MNNEFYTIMDGEGNFINENCMAYNNDSVNDAVRFKYIEDAEEYFENLRKDIDFKIVRVKCELENVD